MPSTTWANSGAGKDRPIRVDRGQLESPEAIHRPDLSTLIRNVPLHVAAARKPPPLIEPPLSTGGARTAAAGLLGMCCPVVLACAADRRGRPES